MTTYATNITTPANAIVTALATAVTNAQTVGINIGPNLPGTTLAGLATKSGWQSDVGDLRTTLASAENDLSVANQKFQRDRGAARFYREYGLMDKITDTIQHLRDRRHDVEQKQIELSAERDRISYDAMTGNANARKRLDEVNASLSASSLDMAVDSALKEAGRRQLAQRQAERPARENIRIFGLKGNRSKLPVI